MLIAILEWRKSVRRINHAKGMLFIADLLAHHDAAFENTFITSLQIRLPLQLTNRFANFGGNRAIVAAAL